MKKLILVSGILLIFNMSAYSSYWQVCKTRYQQGSNWVPYFEAGITFLSGYELNTRARTNKFDQYETYALINLRGKKSIVVHITTFTGCGEKVEEGCIVNALETLRGVDTAGNNWEILVNTN